MGASTKEQRHGEETKPKTMKKKKVQGRTGNGNGLLSFLCIALHALWSKAVAKSIKSCLDLHVRSRSFETRIVGRHDEDEDERFERHWKKQELDRTKIVKWRGKDNVRRDGA
ncbi:hypothetical protein K435DRAFT_212090 [Dendrothele bispora CBS 962.96]|uniref:Uncharacterized protein n=1 Tax=Dendrothele bispora (strain CBS 962.96) TaxID=1314807 RepID=A0A4S8MNN9_DENBC|nr:hypothetical protein K435DRAFT_212090 [Dendrothele bispora CBS 962.96]